MSIVAFDFGLRRIGVAVTDALLLTAHPLGTIERRALKHDLDSILQLLADRNVDRAVVGLPLNMDGSEGEMARRARAFGAALAEVIAVPVEFIDERLSSFEARERLKGPALRRTRRKGLLDAAAAVVILENWLGARTRA